MATKTKPKRKSFSLSLQLAAGRVDMGAGVLYGCTVAKAGVRAQGKTVWLDKDGKVTWDEELIAKELPVFTDEKTLSTIMTCAETAGPRLKAREDHDDSIGARAGFFEMFKREGDRVVADMHLFSSYRNRDVVLETADKTPQEIGLSIDFIPTFELLPDRALMRCKELLAVDIVDEGAITPGGLFLSAGVDTDPNDQPATPAPEPKPPTTMPEKTNPFTDEQLAAVSTLVSKIVGECMTKMTVPAEVTDGLKAIREEQVRLATETKKTADQVATVTSENLRLKMANRALGVRILPNEKDRATLASGTVEDIEKLADPAATPKTYDEIVAARVESTKCKRSEAHLWAMRAHAPEYREHLKRKGIYDPAKVSATA